MQSRNSLAGLATHLILILIGFVTVSVKAQSKEELENKKNSESDSLFASSLRDCLNPLESRKPETWLRRTRVLSSIMDDPNLMARHSQADLPSETANALLMLKALDANQTYRHFTEPGLAGICVDLGNSGIQALENARLYDSEADAERSSRLLEKSMECYKLTGDARNVVDKEWAKHSLDLDWFRFFSGVAFRKSGDKIRASQIYASLLEQEWPQHVLYLEASNLADSIGLIPESIEILEKGIRKLPGNIDLGCALAQQYVRADNMQQAVLWLKKIGKNPQAAFHPEYAFAQAACFEKQGDMRKADFFCRIPYLADSNEVSVIRRYAAFLVRSAGAEEAGKLPATIKTAYRILQHAHRLAPENSAIVREVDLLIRRFPELEKL